MNWQLPLGYNSRDNNISFMLSRLLRDGALEKEYRIYEITLKNNNKQPTRPAPVGSTAGPVLNAKVVGRPVNGLE